MYAFCKSGFTGFEDMLRVTAPVATPPPDATLDASADVGPADPGTAGAPRKAASAVLREVAANNEFMVVFEPAPGNR